MSQRPWQAFQTKKHDSALPTCSREPHAAQEEREREVYSPNGSEVDGIKAISGRCLRRTPLQSGGPTSMATVAPVNRDLFRMVYPQSRIILARKVAKAAEALVRVDVVCLVIVLGAGRSA